MKNKSFFYRVLAVICLTAFLSSPVLAATKKTTKKKNSPKPQPQAASQPVASIPVGMDYAGLVEKVLPSMVLIRTDKMTGSGFFVSNKGDILTNYHVIDGAQKIVVTPYNGKPFSALIKDVDKNIDIALLVPADTRQTPFLKISATLPRQGEAIMAVGNPQGLENTVSNGIVSAFRANKAIVQFTAPVSPGSSGGALINARGEVVGMPTLLLTQGQNLNFAIAPNLLNQFWESASYKKIAPVRQDPITQLRLAAEQGDIRSQFKLGQMYDEGKGVKQDDAQAVYWYRKAGEKGHVNAQYRLATIYSNPLSPAWNYKQAVYWYHKAALQGHADSQCELASLYSIGLGVSRNDEQAVYWYRKAAEQGYARGQYNLGVMYYKDTGVKQDQEQAVYWLSQAANQGNIKAQSQLGFMYYKGKGIKEDYRQAKYWYSKAAEQGDMDALH